MSASEISQLEYWDRFILLVEVDMARKNAKLRGSFEILESSPRLQSRG